MVYGCNGKERIFLENSRSEMTAGSFWSTKNTKGTKAVKFVSFVDKKNGPLILHTHSFSFYPRPSA